MFGYVNRVAEKTLRFVHQPFVQVPVGEDNVKMCFIKALHGSGFGQVSAKNLYERLAELARIANYARQKMEERKRSAAPPAPDIAGIPGKKEELIKKEEKKEEKEQTAAITSGPDGVIAYLSDVAAKYNKTNDATIVENLVKGTSLKDVQVQVLLRWWHQHRSMRRLHLLGLTNAEIRGCYKPLDEIYEICMVNAYRLPSIPLDKAEKIMISMKKTPSAEEIKCGQIVRKMFENQERLGWTCTPVWMLAKQFSGFHALRPILEQDYEVTIEHNSAYLPYPYKVEKFVSEYIDQRVKSTATNLAKQAKKTPSVIEPPEQPGLPLPDRKPTTQEVVEDTIALANAFRGEVVPKEDLPKEQTLRTELDPKDPVKTGPPQDKVQFKEEVEVIPEAKTFTELPPIDTPELESCMFRCKTLTHEQKVAIQGALEHDLSFIRGGAGTGKSSVLAEIVHNLQVREVPFLAVAFTGKAVSRIQELLKSKIAMTMDRAIARASALPPFKHLLVDEISMVTTELMCRFIRAFPGKYKITFVGDSNQLQPIGWGSLMKQLLACKRIPTYTLTKNHRIIKHNLDDTAPSLPVEGEAPGNVVFDRVILENAEMLVDPKRDLGQPVNFKQGTGFYEVEGGVEVVQTIVQQLHNAGIDKDRITVLCPYNEYLDGLNLIFQNVYLENAEKILDKDRKLWSVGTRVMMLVNNYTINVMNGEVGVITSLEDRGIVVQFEDGAEHLFKFESKESQWKRKGEAWKHKKDEDGEADSEDSDLTIDMIRQAFAMSIHKSQGSEQEFVILFFPMKRNSTGGISTTSFLNINLLYTAITRAKRAIWIVGSELAVGQASCKKAPHRFDNLSQRLIQTYDKSIEGCMEHLVMEPKAVEEVIEEVDPEHEDLSMYEN